MVMGILTVAFAGVGWLAGPLAGSAVFRAMYRRQAGEMSLVGYNNCTFFISRRECYELLISNEKRRPAE